MQRFYPETILATVVEDPGIERHRCIIRKREKGRNKVKGGEIKREIEEKNIIHYTRKAL